MRKQIIALVTTAARFVRLEKQEDLITGKRKKKKNPFQEPLGLAVFGLEKAPPTNRDEIRRQKIECRRDFDAILPEIREGLLEIAIKI